IRRRDPVCEHHRGARRRAGRAPGRQPARGALHRGQGGAPRRGGLPAAERRVHLTAVPARARGPIDMRVHRCKVAVSGGGFSRGPRLAEVPLAAPALEAVRGAVEDSGLAMSDVDGLATYPELPATGHAVIDGITIVSVNCMMAMLKLPNLAWHIQVETVNIGGAVQQAVNALLAG